MKRSRRTKRSSNPVDMQPLESRQLLGAPITLASEGLVLASPTSPGDLLGVEAESAPSSEPTTAAAPAATQVAVAPTLAPEEDPLSPTGDPQKAAKPAPVLTTLSGSTYTVDVWMDTPPGNTNVLEFGQTSGFFRFHATACGSFVAASSVTVNYTRSGGATPVDDYSGALANSTSVTIPLTGTSTNKSGTADVAFTAVDDTLEEPQSPESVDVAIANATDNNGQAARVGLFGATEEFGTVASNDYTVSAGLEPTTLIRGSPAPIVDRYLRIQKDGQRINGVKCVAVSVTDSNGQSVNNVITTIPSPPDYTRSNRRETSPGVYEDGVATVTMWAQGNVGDPEKNVTVTMRFEPDDSSQPASALTVTFLVRVRNP